jgi:Zn finger protein HypA/HybF involved in hydrogenase expression
MGYTVGIIIAWVICAFFAAMFAPPGRASEFFLLSLLVLGPLGVGFAAIAPPREAAVRGRQRFVCPRCVAIQYVEIGAHAFTCWRCKKHAAIEHGRLSDSSVGPTLNANVASKTTAVAQKTAVPKATLVGKTTMVRCHNCQHTQKVAASTSTFECENCHAKLQRRVETS